MFWPARPVPCEMACWMLYMHLFLPSFFYKFLPFITNFFTMAACWYFTTRLWWSTLFSCFSKKKELRKMAHFHFNLSKKHIFSICSYVCLLGVPSRMWRTLHAHVIDSNPLDDLFQHVFFRKQLNFITCSGEIEILKEPWTGWFHEGSHN